MLTDELKEDFEVRFTELGKSTISTIANVYALVDLLIEKKYFTVEEFEKSVAVAHEHMSKEAKRAGEEKEVDIRV